MTKQIKILVNELKEHYDYIEKYDAVKFLCRFNSKNKTYVKISDAIKAYNLAY